MPPIKDPSQYVINTCYAFRNYNNQHDYISANAGYYPAGNDVLMIYNTSDDYTILGWYTTLEFNITYVY